MCQTVFKDKSYECFGRNTHSLKSEIGQTVATSNICTVCEMQANSHVVLLIGLIQKCLPSFINTNSPKFMKYWIQCET